MIIDTFRCIRMTRELTNLMRAYNIEILTIDIKDGHLEVSYRANRIFENNEFKELIKSLPEIVRQQFLV